MSSERESNVSGQDASLWKRFSAQQSQTIEFFSVALFYGLVAYAETWLQKITGGVASIWLASGAAVGILLLQKKEKRRVFLILFFVINVWSERQVNSSPQNFPLLALFDTLEAALCVWVVEKFSKPPVHFERAQDVLALLGGALLSSGAFSALEALITLPALFLQSWGANFTADVLGILLLAPIMMQQEQYLNKKHSARHYVEFFALLAAIVLFACLLFGSFTSAENPVLRNYMIFPFLILAAFRFSAHGMSNVLLLFTLVAIGNTAQGRGIFSVSHQNAEQRMNALQTYLSVVSFSGLLLNAIIKERKEAEKSLRVSEEKYRTVVNFTYDWEAWRNPQNEYQYISPACQRVTGYSMEEFTRNPSLILEITHPSDKYIVREHFSRAMHQTEAEIAPFDFRIIKKNGEICWINHACNNVYNEKRKWLGRRESNRDVTARKRIEELMRTRLWLIRFAESHSIDEIAQSGLNETEALTSSEIGFFCLFDDERKIIALQTWSSNALLHAPNIESQAPRYPLNEAGAWADCAREKRTVVHNYYQTLDSKKELPLGNTPARRNLTTPIIRGGTVKAIFGVMNKKTDYDELDEKIVLQLADLTWEIIQRKQSEEQLRLAKEELEELNVNLKLALAREEELAQTDALTGIYNRRRLFQLAQREFELAERHRLPLSIILFDVDHFKNFNDNYGHDIGDEVLIQAVHCARAQLRSGDIIGRYGGEEFVVALPMTNIQNAEQVAERIRSAIEALRVPTAKGNLHITISAGVTEMLNIQHNGSKQTLDNLVRNADEAMYQSKRAGRNCVTLFNVDKAK